MFPLATRSRCKSSCRCALKFSATSEEVNKVLSRCLWCFWGVAGVRAGAGRWGAGVGRGLRGPPALGVRGVAGVLGGRSAVRRSPVGTGRAGGECERRRTCTSSKLRPLPCPCGWFSFQAQTTCRSYRSVKTVTLTRYRAFESSLPLTQPYYQYDPQDADDAENDHKCLVSHFRMPWAGRARC